MSETDPNQLREACFNALKNAFTNVPIPQNAKLPLGRELSWEMFRQIRRVPKEYFPFYLSEILSEILRKTDRDVINDIVEFLDFNLSTTINDAEHKELWGEKTLEVYKQTAQRQIMENHEIVSVITIAQASSILCWLRWIKLSSNFDWWRQEQLEGAIQYWVEIAEE